jgi:uncharacterized phage-like protein YoqJ
MSALGRKQTFMIKILDRIDETSYLFENVISTGFPGSSKSSVIFRPILRYRAAFQFRQYKTFLIESSRTNLNIVFNDSLGYFETLPGTFENAIHVQPGKNL